MKRLPSLFFLSALTSGLVSAQTDTPAATGKSQYWQASLTAETKKDYDGALTQVNSYQTAGGSPFFANLRLGWLSYLKHDYPNAAKYYNEAEQIEPTAINPLLGLMNVSEAQGDPAEIIKSVENVLHLDPLNYQAQMVGAARHYLSKEYAMSYAAYHRVLISYPDDLIALSGEAWSLYYLGRTKEAEAGFQTLLDLNSNDTWAKKGLALCTGGGPE